MKKIQRQLGVITQTRHWLDGARVLAYEPYIREMRIWADLFTNVNIFTSLTHSKIQVAVSEYERQNISFSFVEYDNEVHRWGALTRLFQLPVVIIKMIGFIWRHDVLLIRSPGHFTLIAHILVFLFRKNSITKYAGLFEWFEGERLPSIIERNFIKRVLRPPHYMMVYGKSPAPNFISAIPAVMSKEEIAKLRGGIGPERFSSDKLIFYSLGKLIDIKGFHLAIEGFGLLFKENPLLKWEYHIIGDGPSYEKLVELATEMGVRKRIFFEGKLPYEMAMRHLLSADVVIMPGTKEGWPKVVAEAWAAGSVPLVANAGLLPDIIVEGVNGFLFDPNPWHVKEKLLHLFRNMGLVKKISHRSLEFAHTISTEAFQDKIRKICVEKLKLTET